MNFSFTKLLASFVLGMSLIPSVSFSQEYLDDIMFQSFGWDEHTQTRVRNAGGLYKFYLDKAPTLKANGFDMIWLPPASQSTGGVGYIPTKLYNFSVTSWGTEAELKELLAKFNSLGIAPIADIVVNHRGGTTSWTDFTEPTWGCETIAYDDDGGSLHTATYVGCKPAGANDTGEDFSGARDLDHTSKVVQDGVKEYLTRLKALGFKGWRWDVAKGFSAKYFGEYNKASAPYYSVGEFWDGNTTNLKNWIDGTGNTLSGTTAKSGAFDFANYYQLSSAVRFNSYGVLNSGGRMPGTAGLIGYDDKSVTFVDNHDTFTKPEAILDNNIMKGYAYILTHPGIPCVWAPHYYGGTYRKDGVTRTYTDNSEAINKIMAVRKANQINAYSSISISQSNTTYAAYIKKSFSDANPVIAVKIGSGSWTPTGDGWILNVSGTDYSVWSKSAINLPPTIKITPISANYLAGETKAITLEATDDKAGVKIYYTTNGVDPTTASALYTSALNISETTTVKAIAVDSDGAKSAIATEKYVFASASTFTVYFKKPDTWTNSRVNIHHWNAVPAGLAGSTWPGKQMDGPDANGLYSFTFENIAFINIIFNSGTSGTPQTADINSISNNNPFMDNCFALSGSAIVDCNTLSTSENIFETNELFLAPNPTQSNFKVSVSTSEIQIFDFSGKIVKAFYGNFEAEHAFDVNDLAKGLYIVKIKSNTGESSILKLAKN